MICQSWFSPNLALAWRPFRALIGLGVVLTASFAFALDPGRQLSEYHHQLFSPRGAALTQVTQVAQTDDGYLWVGTSVGLYRFDGVSFQLMSSLGGQSIQHLPVNVVFAEPGGGLWIGFGGGGGAGHYKGGVYKALGVEQGWGSMNSGVVDADGVTWVVADHKLLRIDKIGTPFIAADWGLQGMDVHELVLDKAGTLWVSLAGENDLIYLLQGERRFRALEQYVGGRLLAAAPDGTIFVSGSQGLRAVVTRAGRPEKLVRVSDRPCGRVLADRDGGLLVATPLGLAHVGSVHQVIESGGHSELTRDVMTLNLRAPDSAARVWSLMEDRDGNIWIGSNMGLDRIRDTRLTPLTVLGSEYPGSVVAGAGGSVWASSWSLGLLKVDNHSSVTVVKDLGSQVSTVYRDQAGSIWAGARSGLWRSNSQGQFRPMAVPTELLQPWVLNMALDADGTFWFTANDLVRSAPGNGDWRKASADDGFGKHPAPRAMYADASGRIWMATGRQILRVEGGRPRPLAALSEQVKVGAIQNFSERNGHFWIGGIEGLALVHGETVTNLRTRSGSSFNQVLSILETASGDLWVRGADEAWRVASEELRAALASGRSEVEAEYFDSMDGLSNMSVRPRSALAEAADGLIWFSTNKGLAWYDPSVPRRPVRPPPAHIQQVSIDGQIKDVTEAVDVPPLSRRLEISYTAIDLGYPERLQFRYKLEGFDSDWQSAGTRRIAYYNDLPPGDYQFHFASTDRDGHWQNAATSALSLRVAPAWFQTLWFKILVGVTGFLTLALLYHLRMRHVAMRLQTQLRQQMAERDRIVVARHAERERIARELHDTLIQSTQGLIYLFQGLSERISIDERTRLQLDNALVRANEVAAEGRDRIEDLRETVKVGTDLPRALASLGNELLVPQALPFRTIVSGAAREIRPAVIDAISWIAREALVNACRHSQATVIEIEILHDDEALVVSIRDDGRGLSEDVLMVNPAGHWGIRGMRERATSIDAQIEFLPRQPTGTEVRLTTPGNMAYGDMTGRFRWRIFERGSRAH